MAGGGGYSGADRLGGGQGTGSNLAVSNVTAEALVTGVQACVTVLLKAADGNTGLIYYQTDGNAATVASFELGAGDMTGWIPVPGNDLANISVLSSVDGEDIFYHWLA